MKVVKPSPYRQGWKSDAICPHCKAELEVELSDLNVSYYSGDQREQTDGYYNATAKCGDCQSLFTVAKVPQDVLAFAYKEKSKNSAQSYYDHR